MIVLAISVSCVSDPLKLPIGNFQEVAPRCLVPEIKQNDWIFESYVEIKDIRYGIDHGNPVK